MSSFYEFPHAFHTTPMWSPATVEVLVAADAEDLAALINLMLATPECNVLAISAAQTTATYGEERWTSTVIVQTKADPNAWPQS